MASGWGSPLGITGIVMIILGIILAIIGIVLLINYQNQSIPWWVWLMLVGGVIIAIIGGIMLAIALSSQKKKVIEYRPMDQCGNIQVPFRQTCGPNDFEQTVAELDEDFSF